MLEDVLSELEVVLRVLEDIGDVEVQVQTVRMQNRVGLLLLITALHRLRVWVGTEEQKGKSPHDSVPERKK